MGQLIGFGSDCFGCGMGADPALPGSVDPSSILPANLTPATTTQVAAMAESAKKDMLFYAVGAVGIALLIDWLVFGKKSYKANARRGYAAVPFGAIPVLLEGAGGTHVYAGRRGRSARIRARGNRTFAESRLRRHEEPREVVALLQERGLSHREAEDIVLDVIPKILPASLGGLGR